MEVVCNTSLVWGGFMGNKVGAVVTIKAPAGEREYEIQGISFGE